MEPAGILRAVALFCLGTLFSDSVVTAQQTAACPEPATVKDTLDLLGKLGNNDGLKEKVSKQIEESVQKYLDTNGISGKSVKQNLDELFKKVTELRQNLLKTPGGYGKYAGVTESDINVPATVLINWLPILHSEMWFLYFQTATECKRLGGNWWTVQAVGGTDGKKDLTNWLTSQEPGIPLIPKGFSENELKDGRHPDIAAKTGIKLHQGEPLNYAQYGLLFLSSKWQHSNLASATLFLQEFCREVNKVDGIFKNKLSEDKYKGLKTVCGTLSPNLKSLFDQLWPLYSPISVEEEEKEETQKEIKEQHKDAHNKIYEGKLKSDSFDKYIEWLKKSLVGINDSLKEMAKSSWSIDELSNATMAGPFKYGFVFKDAWDETALYRKLDDVTKKLCADFSSLATTLGSPLPQPAKPSPSEDKGGKSAGGEKPIDKSILKPEDDVKGKGKSPPKQTEAPVKPTASEDSTPAKPKKSFIPPVAPKGSNSDVSKDSPADPKVPEAQLRSEEESQPSSFMATTLLSCMLACVMISVF